MNENATVLIVDDMPSILQTLAACLKDEYRVKVATSGQRCFELLDNDHLPDVILLDVMMPEMDGFAVIRKLKANMDTAHIPVIFLTGKDEEAEEEEGLILGAADYITKPIRPAIVKARIRAQVTLKRQKDQLLNMAMHDHLTGLYNRHYLVEAANQKIAQAFRHHKDLCILLLDIDRFKEINDKFGHDMGDKVLQSLSQTLQDLARKEDIVARIGGEEFVIVLGECGLAAAKAKAEQLRSAIENSNPQNLHVTTSIGLAALGNFEKAEERFEDILNRADKFLYLAKSKGRNCVAFNFDDNEESTSSNIQA